MENNRLYRETLAMAEKEREIRNVFQKFVPKEIVDKITLGVEAGDTRPIEEFRSLTLLNIDIRGFSPISKKIGPRKTVAMLNQYFATMGNIVFKHHGIVDKYLGDGFLALFGAPVSSTSDADNAVAAAMEMQQAINDLNRGFFDRYNVTLVMGIVVHSGEVVVGNIGFEKKMDYTVIGDAVNFVFKLQSVCKAWPNQILISEKTLQATQSPPKTDEIGNFEIEGGTDPLKIYRVLE
jgi:adenylate cyclase